MNTFLPRLTMAQRDAVNERGYFTEAEAESFAIEANDDLRWGGLPETAHAHSYHDRNRWFVTHRYSNYWTPDDWDRR